MSGELWEQMCEKEKEKVKQLEEAYAQKMKAAHVRPSVSHHPSCHMAKSLLESQGLIICRVMASNQFREDLRFSRRIDLYSLHFPRESVLIK